MARKSIQSYALLRAVRLLGGEPRAAKLIGISDFKLGLYLEDRQSIPEAVFLRVVDILVDNETQRLLQSTGAECAVDSKKKGNGKGRKA